MKSQNTREGEVLIINLQGLQTQLKITALIIIISLLLAGCDQLPFLSSLVQSTADTQSHTLILDDFSDKDSGWGQFIYPEGAAEYKKDTYEISVKVPNSDIFITYPRIYINSIVEANISKVEGAEDGNYGLICRFEDERNFYAGQINSEGYAGIFRVKNGKYELVGRKMMVPVPAILGGNNINKVRFECVEKTLTLSINGEVADTQTDEAFISGEVGMIAGTVSDYTSVFRFDDFYADVR